MEEIFVVIRKDSKLDITRAFQHSSQLSAEEEAKKLCQKERDTFFIYKIQLVATARIALPPVEIIRAEDCFE